MPDIVNVIKSIDSRIGEIFLKFTTDCNGHPVSDWLMKGVRISIIQEIAGLLEGYIPKDIPEGQNEREKKIPSEEDK